MQGRNTNIESIGNPGPNEFCFNVVAATFNVVKLTPDEYSSFLRLVKYFVASKDDKKRAYDALQLVGLASGKVLPFYIILHLFLIHLRTPKFYMILLLCLRSSVHYIGVLLYFHDSSLSLPMTVIWYPTC